MAKYQSKYTGEEIDSLLEKVENNDSTSEKNVTLWEGNVNTVNTPITLSQSLEDFYYLLIEGGYELGAGHRVSPAVLIPVSSIKTYDETIKFIGLSYNMFQGTTSYATLILYMQAVNATELNITDITNKASTPIKDVYITKIVGIKL